VNNSSDFKNNFDNIMTKNERRNNGDNKIADKYEDIKLNRINI